MWVSGSLLLPKLDIVIKYWQEAPSGPSYDLQTLLCAPIDED